MMFDRRSALGALIALGALAAAGCSNTGAEAVLQTDDGPVVRGLSYIGISVSDIDRTAAYFTGAGGLLEVDRSELRAFGLDRIAGKKISARTRTLRSNSGQIRLMQFDRPAATASGAAYRPAAVLRPHLYREQGHLTRDVPGQ